jgi:hypothetical protein
METSCGALLGSCIIVDIVGRIGIEHLGVKSSLCSKGGVSKVRQLRHLLIR